MPIMADRLSLRQRCSFPRETLEREEFRGGTRFTISIDTLDGRLGNRVEAAVVLAEAPRAVRLPDEDDGGRMAGPRGHDPTVLESRGAWRPAEIGRAHV